MHALKHPSVTNSTIDYFVQFSEADSNGGQKGLVGFSRELFLTNMLQTKAVPPTIVMNWLFLHALSKLRHAGAHASDGCVRHVLTMLCAAMLSL